MSEVRLSVLSSHLRHKQMAAKPHITTHILDISRGLPAPNVPVSLYLLVDGKWTLIKQGVTNSDGRCAELTGNSGITPGTYKLHFETGDYFSKQNQATFFPFIEVIFDMCSPSEHYHVPLLLGPHGYTTYRGS